MGSDGRAVACGSNRNDQCNLPALEEGLTFKPALPPRTLVLQMAFDETLLHFATLAGDELCHLNGSGIDLLTDIHEQLLCAFRPAGACPRVEVILPGGGLMSKILANDPE